MDLDTFKRRLEELEERFQQWIEPIERVHMVSIYKVNKDGYTLDDHEREVKQIAQSQIAQYDPYQDIHVLLDQWCPIYLGASPQQRAEIRSAVSNKEGIWSGLINYVYRAAGRLQSPVDRQWLPLGLAAISIEDCRMDFRDTLMALAELYVAAEKAGIDPEPDFREVAELSSSQVPSGGTTPVSEMLFKFHSYAVLKERRNRPEGGSEKEEAPWKRRIYHFEQIGKYVEDGRKGSKIQEERVPWWKRVLGFDK
jgi:hypothetical protein